MRDYNKRNLNRLAAAFASLAIVFLAVVAASVSLKFWWASLPTSGAAIAAAVRLFYCGFVKPDIKDKINQPK